jgi:MFS family permease
LLRDIRLALNQPTSQRSYFLGILNGVSTRVGMSLTHPSMVLSVFIRTLGGSNALVGLLPAIRFGGWFLPQFLVASWIQPKPRKVPTVVALETVRVLIYGALVALTCALGLSYPRLLLVLFFVLFTLSRLAAGTGALARMDAIGKIVPPARRASFFAARGLWGGAIVFGAGFLVRDLLDPTPGLTFPVNFALLFGLSGLSFLVAVLSFSRVKETPGPEGQAPHSLKAQLARAPVLLKQDPEFKRYLVARILLNTMRIAEPFYTVFALDILGAPVSMVGFYLSAMTLANILSNPLWQRAERTRGTYFMVKAASLLTVLAPLLAATLPWLMRAAGFTVERYGLLPAYLFTGVFLLAGSANSGRGIGLMALLLDIAPDQERASYVGLVNTALGFVSFLPILAGAIIDRVGFEPIFFATTFLLLLGYLVTLGWKPR